MEITQNELTAEQRFWEKAKKDYDGHATVMTFTTRCVAAFGTIDGDVREWLTNHRLRFSTLEDAMDFAVRADYSVYNAELFHGMASSDLEKGFFEDEV